MINKEYAPTITGWLDYLENHGYMFFIEEMEGIFSPDEYEEQWQLNEHLLDMFPLYDWCKANR